MNDLAITHDGDIAAPSTAAPPYLSALAGHEWNRLAPDLIAQGRLQPTDHALLALYCASWARWVEAEARLVQQVLPDADLRDWHRRAVHAAAQMRAALADLNLTPAARARSKETDVQTQPPEIKFVVVYEDQDSNAVEVPAPNSNRPIGRTRDPKTKSTLVIGPEDMAL